MRIGIVALVGALMISGGAHAESWKTKLVLMTERSPHPCLQMSLDGVVYEFKVEGNALSGTSSTGAQFTAPIAADGAVKVSFVTRGGNPVELSGNAKTRDLELLTPRNSCRTKLVPVQ